MIPKIKKRQFFNLKFIQMKNFFAMLLIATVFLFGSAFTNSEFTPTEKELNGEEVKLTTTVVIYKNGKRVGSGYKVSLEFVGGLLSGGFTDNFYTNSDGVAYVEHASEGAVKIYVNGNWSDHRTKGKAPGKITVYL